MKILYCIRKNYLKNVAGDSIQLIKTAEYIRKMGISVDINSGNITDYSRYNIIHLFNLTRISETYQYYKSAKELNKKIVITPIYWNLERYYRSIGSIDNVLLWQRYKKFRSEILNSCSMIYPSSIMEKELIKNEYGDNLPFKVIYNGINVNELYKKERVNLDKDKKPYIFCAARICPRKNQHVLAKICNRLGYSLILAGEAKNREYLGKCLAYKNVTYKGFLDINRLSILYKNTKLHVLCSFLETPGLSSLEAGAWGCNIVTTSEGSTKEYFKDMAFYCNPYDESNIYEAVEQGLKINYQPKLKKHIIENFNLSKCLNNLYENYLSLFDL